MPRKLSLLVFISLLIILSACNLTEILSPLPTSSPTSTETSTPSPTHTTTSTQTITSTLTATSTLTSSSTFVPTTTLTRTLTKSPTVTFTHTRTRTSTPAASCEITAITAATAYSRPSLAADIFGTVSAGMKLTATVKTTDNWYGFDPGVAQAGNVGVFRYRWVRSGANLSISHVCNNIRILDKVPLPGICYVMSMGSTPVRTTPSTSASVIYTFTLGDYAQALGKSGTWIKVNLAISNISGLSMPGWVQQGLVGLNGCATPLPVVSP